jgi:hypothetical protein
MTPVALRPTHADLATLHALLDAGVAYAPTYGGRLSNHLPMAQQALHDLGANAERMQAWTAAHATHLEPSSQALHAGAPVLGEPDSEPAWRVHFTALIAARGDAEALRDGLPMLLPGVGAIAFHGLIRTAHAQLAGHPGELAAGLAHWAAHFMPLPDDADCPPLPLAAWLSGLASLPRPVYPAGSFITDRMAAWGRVPGFAAAAGCLQHHAGTLRELALLAARTYATTGNFTVLHLLTASHAMTVLQPGCPSPELHRGFSVAVAAGLLASGASPALALPEASTRPWPSLIAAACAQDDAHVIKLTHAAWRLDQLWPDVAWRAAVARAIPVGWM